MPWFLSAGLVIRACGSDAIDNIGATPALPPSRSSPGGATGSLIPKRILLAEFRRGEKSSEDRILEFGDGSWRLTINRVGARFGASLGANRGRKGAPPTLAIGGSVRGPDARRDAILDVLRFSTESGAYQLSNILKGERARGGWGKLNLAIGDFDSDGGADLLIGDYAAPVIGRVWHLQEKTNGSNLTALLRAGPGDIRRFGASLADVGDVNGDGYPDVVVGAPHTSSPGGEHEGAAFLYFGGPEGLQTNSVWKHSGRRVKREFGDSVAAAGDVNHDGLDDVLIGAPLAENQAHVQAGRACLFLGAPDGLGDRPTWVWKGPHAFSVAGRSLAGLGDVNGDGHPDIAVGVPGHAGRAGPEEFVAVFYGSKSGFPPEPSAILKSDRPYCSFGLTLAAVGDINRDGFNDLVVGAPGYSKIHPSDGRVSVFLGSTNGLQNEPVWTIEGGQEEARCGDAICALGDIDGDGCDDFAVGSPGYTGVAANQGRVDIFLGSTSAYVRVATKSPSTDGTQVLIAAPLETTQTNWLVMCIIAFGTSILAVTFVYQVRQARGEAERERVRIARDLHDELGSRLTTLGLLSQSGTETQQTEHHRDEMARKAREVLDSMETIVWSVKPANDTLENLVRFMTQYAGPYCTPAGIQCSFEIPTVLPNRILPPDRRKNIFLIYKEALTNVVKHSGATEVSINVRLNGETLWMQVADNGRGISVTASSGDDADGLDNMRARTRELGGDFEIGPRHPNGTAVMISVPLRGRVHWWRRWTSLSREAAVDRKSRLN